MAIAEVSLITETESAFTKANLKTGDEVEVKAEKPVPVIVTVVELAMARPVTVTRVLEV